MGRYDRYDERRGLDAGLDGWAILTFGSLDPDRRARLAIAGQILQDRKGRWPDGRTIVTSQVVTDPDRIANGSVIATLNSRYLLGRRRGEALN